MKLSQNYGSTYQKMVKQFAHRGCLMSMKESAQSASVVLNWACLPGGHCWNYSSGTLSFSHITATPHLTH